MSSSQQQYLDGDNGNTMDWCSTEVYRHHEHELHAERRLTAASAEHQRVQEEMQRRTDQQQVAEQQRLAEQERLIGQRLALESIFLHPGLGRLPGQLRNTIYELVLPEGASLNVTEHPTFGIPPPLLQVCRAMHAEALPIYYSQNIFELNITEIAQVQNWLVSISSSGARHLRKVKIVVRRRPDHEKRLWHLCTTLNAVGVCRDAISGVELDRDGKLSETPSALVKLRISILTAEYRPRHSKSPHAPLPCKICCGDHPDGNSESHVPGHRPHRFGKWALRLQEGCRTARQVLADGNDFGLSQSDTMGHSAVDMIEGLSLETGLTFASAKDCLPAVEWDHERAKGLFWELKDQVPDDAFVLGAKEWWLQMVRYEHKLEMEDEDEENW